MWCQSGDRDRSRCGDSKMIQSPCMKICIFDQESGYCLGCSRTEDEVIKWKDSETTDEWKKENLKELREREQQ